MPEYLENRNIDRTKWDDCIARSCFETIYPYSWYLDLTAKNWDGIIDGDYKAVFPVTWNVKHGIHYVFPPLLTQQLGLFSGKAPGTQQIGQFLNVLPRRFKHIEISLNASNTFSSKEFKASRLVNYELDLADRYGVIKDRYSLNTRRNLHKSEDQSLRLTRIDADEYIGLKKRNNDPLKDKDLEAKLTTIFCSLDEGNKGEIWGAFHNEKLCSAVVWAYSKTRRIYLNSVSDETGRDLRAMFLLVDDFIKNNSGKPFILDFEGSMIPGIARFFEGFGASRNDYTRIRKSSFPLNIVLK
jgi:hypothetical protein